MKINIESNIDVNCNHFKENDPDFIEKDIKIRIVLNKSEASKFIFRFAPNIFNIKDYTVIIKMDDKGNIVGVVLKKGNDLYVVKNIDSVFTEIAESYIRIRTTEKINGLLELDFDPNEDDEGFIDEFDL